MSDVVRYVTIKPNKGMPVELACPFHSKSAIRVEFSALGESITRECECQMAIRDNKIGVTYTLMVIRKDKKTCEV